MRLQTDERRIQLVAATTAMLFVLIASGLGIRQVYAADGSAQDNVVHVSAWRLQLGDPPKVTFMVKVLGDLASFFIAYQPVDSEPGDPPKTTPEITVDPNDTRKQYGDYLAGSILNSEALAPDAEYVFWLVGTYRDVARKLHTSPKGKFTIEPIKGLKEGLLTGQARQTDKDKTTVTFEGYIGKPKDDGVAFIEYGTNPNRLDSKTREKYFAKEDSVFYRDEEHLLQPDTTYFYRFVVDYANQETARGGILNIKLAKLNYKKNNPCEGRMLPAPYYMATRLSEDLAVVCSIHNLSPSIYKGSGVYGQLVCPAQFPRNLNTTALDLTIPKVEIPVSIEQKGVSFWRSTVDVRFDEWMFWAQKGEEGQQDPVRQGSQKYEASNWSPQPQTLVVWIYCSSNWSAPNSFR